MLVYRVCSKYEIDYIFNNRSFFGLGGFGNGYRYNNHGYLPGVRYMHFFSDKHSVIYHEFYRGSFVCTYDIPDEMALACHGIGEYRGRKGAYAAYLDELAIDSREMKFEYLKMVEQFIPQEYFYDLDCFEEDLVVRYNCNIGILRERKKEEESS